MYALGLPGTGKHGWYPRTVNPDPRPSPFDAVVFDLDGVIVDTEIWWDDERARFAHAHRRDWTFEDRRAVMGANSATWSRIMRDRLRLDLATEAIERAVVDAMVERYRRLGAPNIDGAAETVARIAERLPVAVASSAHPRVIAAALEATGLANVFRAVVSADELPAGKPAPDVYLEAARRLGVDPRRSLAVEDSLNGVRAARAAGMTVVLVPNASVPPAPGASDLADATLSSLADLDVEAIARRGRE